jgi:hypothetical protein
MDNETKEAEPVTDEMLAELFREIREKAEALNHDLEALAEHFADR